MRISYNNVRQPLNISKAMGKPISRTIPNLLGGCASNHKKRTNLVGSSVRT